MSKDTFQVEFSFVETNLLSQMSIIPSESHFTALFKSFCRVVILDLKYPKPLALPTTRLLPLAELIPK